MQMSTRVSACSLRLSASIACWWWGLKQHIYICFSYLHAWSFEANTWPLDIVHHNDTATSHELVAQLKVIVIGNFVCIDKCQVVCASLTSTAEELVHIDAQVR